jgi:hypothetical protein
MPHTVLIGQNGNVKAITTPDQVKAVVIQRILSGADVALNPKPEFSNNPIYHRKDK